MKRERTFNTLFMLSSLDGKISTGSIEKRDFDKDLPKIDDIKEGLGQYYDLEKKTDIHSLNSGKVMAKIGINTTNHPINCSNVSFIIVDSKHLNEKGLNNLINNTKKLYLVTTDKNHPAFKFKEKLELLFYPKEIDFKDLFEKLMKKFGVKRITIQSGGTLNSKLIRLGLIDRISLVVAPVIVGGKDTASLVDGPSLLQENDFKKIKSLNLIKCQKLKKSYLHLVYSVNN